MAVAEDKSLTEYEGEALDYATRDRMTERYQADDSLPEDVRRSYSLRSDES